MSIPKFVQRFASLTILPIDLDEKVVPEVRALGLTDELYFYPDPKLNPAILKGDIKHWEYPADVAGTIRRVVDITYSGQLDPEWQRIVCCKEVLHMLDPEAWRAANPDEIDELIKKIVLPPELEAASDGVHAVTDRLAIHYACAVLFPLAARNELIQPYKDGRLSLPEIADLAELPLYHTAWVMSDVWPKVHDILIK